MFFFLAFAPPVPSLFYWSIPKPITFLMLSVPSPPLLLNCLPKGRTIRKLMGGGGLGVDEVQKKIRARENLI